MPIAPYLGHELPGQMPGAIISTMDTKKHMMRMVRRGLLRNPFKRFKYLEESMSHLRSGPLGRRNKEAKEE